MHALRPALPVLLAVLLVCAGGSIADADDVPVTPETIDEAIANAVGYLLEEQKPNGTWGNGDKALGHTALAVFALLHAGVNEAQRTPEAKRLRRAFKFLDRNGPGREGKRDVDPGTYTTSLLLLVLRDRGREADRTRMQRLVDLLCRTQAKNGQWWYYGRPAKTGKTGPDTGDNSNTQFAVLALGAAVGEGLNVSKATLERAAKWWHGSLGKDGGYGYASGGGKSASSASMTAAGIACLAVLEAALPVSEPATPNPTKAPPGLAEALEWLEKHYSVTKNHGPAKGQAGQRQKRSGRGWLHYYLWTLERAMVLWGADRVGEHDWYREGAAQLLKTQKKDGSWRGEAPVFATSFGLLFLTRAADPPRAFTPKKKPFKAPVTGPTEEDEEQPDEKDERVPPGTVQDWLALDLPVGELASWCRKKGPSALRGLVVALGDPDKTKRRRAWEALSALLPKVRLARADRHPLARGRLALWIRKHEDVLKLDAKGRFVPEEE